VGSIVAQGVSDSSGCRFAVGGVVEVETIAHEVDACTIRLLKAA